MIGYSWMISGKFSVEKWRKWRKRSMNKLNLLSVNEDISAGYEGQLLIFQNVYLCYKDNAWRYAGNNREDAEYFRDNEI
jgi:hypothetical protein